MYPITSRFNDFESFRKFPHKGIDFAMSQGTPLKAIAEGRVQVIDYGELSWGKTVMIKAKDGMTYIYGHLSEFNVKNGDYIRQGELLGLSGNTGNVFPKSSGYHLDFSVKNEQGQFIDPTPYADFIQNMNNPEYMRTLLDKSTTTESVFNLGEVLQQFSEGLSNIDFGTFGQMTVNVISLIARISIF